MLGFLETVDIPGWMGDVELEFLYSMVTDAPPDALMVEVGTWLGRSIAAQYTAMHGQQTVVAIDTWLGQANMRFGVHSEVLYEDIFLKFLAYMKQIGIVPRWWRPGKIGACYLRMHFTDAVQLLPDGGVHRVFIDGDHDAVGTDIDLITPKLAPGAILCGHDYNWVGVKDMVEARFPIREVRNDLWIASLD